MKPLIWKELRENVRWLPIGMFVGAVSCYMAYSSCTSGNSLLAISLVGYFTISMPLLAFALGVVQSYRDLQPGPGAYLNHRHVTASDVFLAKALSGFLLFMLAVTVPVLGLAAWVAFQGMWIFPMRPAQVVPSLVFAMASFAMHPAAMLMMSRSASWWGTRLFPLVPAGLALLPFHGYLERGGLYWAAVCFAIAVAALAWMFSVARQGWQQLACDPPASSVNPSLSRRWLMPSYLLLGSLFSLVVAVFFLVAAVDQVSRSHFNQRRVFTALAVEEGSDGFWLVTRLGQYDERGVYSISTLGGAVVKQGATVNANSTVAKDRELREFNTLSPPNAHTEDGFFSMPTQIQGGPLHFTYDLRGYLIGYQLFPQRRWVNTIAADGVFPAGVFQGTPFEQNPLRYQWSFPDLSNYGYPVPLIDSKSISFVDKDSIRIRTVLQTQIDGVALVHSKKGQAPRLMVLSGSELQEYKLVDESGSDQWYVEPESGDDNFGFNRDQVRGLRLDVELIRTFSLPATFVKTALLRIGWTPESVYVAQEHGPRAKQLRVHRLQEGKASETIAASIDPETLPQPEGDNLQLNYVLAGMLPGAVFLTGFGIASYLVVTGRVPTDPFQEMAAYPVIIATVLTSFIIITVVSFWLVRVTAVRRGLSRHQTMLWSFAVPILGLAAPLSIISMYRLVHREPCPKCNASRRVDTKTCEHCGAHWEAPANEGIEICDHRSVSGALLSTAT